MWLTEEMRWSELQVILQNLTQGKIDEAIDRTLTLQESLANQGINPDFVSGLRDFIDQYQGEARFIHALAAGNLDVDPPIDKTRSNIVISEFKQLHSNLRHLTWQTQQVAKGDLKQKVSFMGDFSVAYNKMIESLREKKLLEEQIHLQNEQLKLLISEKDKFFSIIAHDLRGPLGGFMSLSELMVDLLPDLSHEETRQMALSMKNSASGIFGLLENLLEWARMQRGITKFEPEKMDIGSKIHDCIQVISENAHKKSIHIEYTSPESVFIYADPNMISSVLRNLLTNAIKFTHAGGIIRIEAGQTGNNSVIVSIRDSGIGMNPTMLGKLFRIDQNVSRSGTEKESSSGLGLILCKDFMDKHQGEIWAESEENVGSTFYIRLPSFENG